jgi:hypothetical protein
LQIAPHGLHEKPAVGKKKAMQFDRRLEAGSCGATVSIPILLKKFTMKEILDDSIASALAGGFQFE